MKTIFDLIQEGKKEDLEQLCLNEPSVLKERDDLDGGLLHVAAEAGQWEVFELLEKLDTSTHYLKPWGEEDANGYTAFHRAVWGKHEEIARKLLKRDRNVLYHLFSEETWLCFVIKSGNEDVFNLLYQLYSENDSALIWTANNMGLNVLHHAVFHKRIEMFKTLVKKIDDITFLTQKTVERGNNLIHWAVLSGSSEMLELVWDTWKKEGLKPNPNTRNHANIAPIHLAAHFEKCAPLIPTLLALGANPSLNITPAVSSVFTHDRFGLSDYHGIEVDDEKVIEQPLSTPLTIAIQASSKDAVQFLLKGGAEVNPTPCLDSNKKPAVHSNPMALALSLGNFTICRLLAEYGASMMVAQKILMEQKITIGFSEDQMRALRHAAASLHRHCLQEHTDLLAEDIINKRFDINGLVPLSDIFSGQPLPEGYTKDDCWTPLHCAAYQKNGKVMAFLIQHGASLETKDKLGQTPANLAGNDSTSSFLKTDVHLLNNLLEQRKPVVKWLLMFYSAQKDAEQNPKTRSSNNSPKI